MWVISFACIWMRLRWVHTLQVETHHIIFFVCSCLCVSVSLSISLFSSQQPIHQPIRIHFTVLSRETNNMIRLGPLLFLFCCLFNQHIQCSTNFTLYLHSKCTLHDSPKILIFIHFSLFYHPHLDNLLIFTQCFKLSNSYVRLLFSR